MLQYPALSLADMLIKGVGDKIKGVGDKTQSFSFVTDPFNLDRPTIKKGRARWIAHRTLP